jgi:hypothetical protein
MKAGLFSTPRRRILLLAAVAVALAVFLATPGGPREPVYQGKRFTEWAALMVPHIDPATGLPVIDEEDKVRAALDAIGTNALPFLLKEFNRPISRWRGRLAAEVNCQPYLRIHLRTDEERIITAGWGLVRLGTNAAPALPVLAGHLNDPHRFSFVTMIFNSVGEAALPHLTAAVSSRDPFTARNAVVAVQGFGYPFDQQRAVLAVALRHADAGVRAAAVAGWSHADWRTQDVVADLLKLAHDPSLRVVPEVSNQLVRLSGLPLEPRRTDASNALLTLRPNAPPPRAP